MVAVRMRNTARTSPASRRFLVVITGPRRELEPPWKSPKRSDCGRFLRVRACPVTIRRASGAPCMHILRRTSLRCEEHACGSTTRPDCMVYMATVATTRHGHGPSCRSRDGALWRHREPTARTIGAAADLDQTWSPSSADSRRHAVPMRAVRARSKRITTSDSGGRGSLRVSRGSTPNEAAG